MSEEVCRAIAAARSGYVEAPAGCGKTEAIVKTVGSYCADPQLILTHTHAGVHALRQRFRKHQVPSSRFRIDTIAGSSWGWVRKYPHNAGYDGSLEFADWNIVYAAMANLLTKPFVRQGILNSYAGVIVDEYQDCTIPMHALIAALKSLLPCRVLGDDLQGIFDFRGQALVPWADMQAEFRNDLGALDMPHRWIEAGNRRLGEWLLSVRPTIRQGREPDFRGAPVDRRSVSSQYIGAELLELTDKKNGRICVIRPKARDLRAGVETTLVKRGYAVLEPNDLSTLRDLIQDLSGGTPRKRATAAFKYFGRVYGGIDQNDKDFITHILNGRCGSVRRQDRKALAALHGTGTTPRLLLDLLAYTDGLPGASCKLAESVSALKCILERHIETGADLKSLYADEIARRKYQGRSNDYRCIGSTLLVKGLEFDHAIIVRGQNWGGIKDLYVALTRGSRSTTLIELMG